MIVDRLIYGCARLTGGASARSSRRLVETCLAAGIRHFDSAPSYGLGTAEAVLGTMLHDRPDVRITAKVGSARPRGGTALTYARALKAMVVPRASPLRDGAAPPSGRDDTAPAMSLAALAHSIDRSRQALRRDCLDVLLLHEIRRVSLDAEVGLLEQARCSGLAAAVGWSTGAVVTDTPAGVPRHWIAQAAASPAMLRLGGEGAAPHYLHGIASVALLCERTDVAIAQWATGASALIPDKVADRRTALIAATFARLHALMPDRGLIFASIDPSRLTAFLAAVRHIDREVGAAAFGGDDLPT